MKFEQRDQHLVVDNYCSRCRRPFLPGQRVRLVYAGPVDRPFGANLVGVSVFTVNQFVEHENIDHCTEGR